MRLARTIEDLTEEQILEYVTMHASGFDYAQLQTGIGKYELEELLIKHGFEKCDYCFEEWGIDENDGFPVCWYCREELNLWQGV